MKAHLAAGLSVLLCMPVVGLLLLMETPWPSGARDFLAASGYVDTGAANLVSAIYLGYRAYDTLGETVVLLAALTGAMGLIQLAKNPGVKELTAEGESEETPAMSQRTDIINTTAGKLAPIVLILGWYLMFYGHVSPGGGFQGGVVLASGIVFIAIGRREGGLGKISDRRQVFSTSSLAKTEALAYAVILILCFSGLYNGSFFMGNPVQNSSLLSPVSYIIAFNAAIGLKVGSGIALVCLLMMGAGHD